MTAGRLKEIARMAKRTSPAKIHDLYMEIYGADFAGQVTVERARASIREACHELLAKGGKLPADFDPPPPPEPAVEAEPEPAVKAHRTRHEHLESTATERPLARRPTTKVRKHRTLEPL